jgi:hypothetical protein
MDSFNPLIKAVISYAWLIFFALAVFIFQKPIIRFFRKLNQSKKNIDKKDR